MAARRRRGASGHARWDTTGKRVREVAFCVEDALLNCRKIAVGGRPLRYWHIGCPFLDTFRDGA